MLHAFYAVAAGLLPTLLALFTQQGLHRPLPVLGNMLLSVAATAFGFTGWVIAMIAVIQDHDPNHFLRWIVYLGVILPTVGIAGSVIGASSHSWQQYRGRAP